MTHLDNPPPSHWQLMAVAFAIDFVVLFGALFSLLTIRATAQPACTCDCGEET